MERFIINKQRMHSGVKTVLNKHVDIWSNSIPFKNSYNLFSDTYDKIEEKELEQTSSKGVTKEKKQIMDNMLDVGLIICGGGLAYTSVIKNKELGESFNFTKTSLKAGKDKEIYDRCKLISKNADTIKDKLVDYNISLVQVNLFNDLVIKFYEIINVPRETRKSSKTSKKEMIILIDECDRILNEVIDKLMLTYKESHPDFYLEYFNARIIGGWRKKKDEEETPVV